MVYLCNTSDWVIQTAGEFVEMSGTFKFFAPKHTKISNALQCFMILFPIFRLKLPTVSKFFLVPSTKNSVLLSFSFGRVDFIQDLMSLMQFSRFDRQVSWFVVVSFGDLKPK